VRTRLQTQTQDVLSLTNFSSTGANRKMGIIETIKIMKNEEGLRGFYKGLSTNLLRTVPASVITILTYEMVLAELNHLFCSTSKSL